MRFKAMICAALLLVPPVLAPADAAAQEAQRLATQYGLIAIGTAQEFEVLTRAGAGKNDYYCAAGEFAKIRLYAGNTEQLVVASGMVPSRYRDNRQAIVFGLAGRARQGMLSLHLGRPRAGQTMSVGHARSLCNALGPRAHGHRHHD